jgi:tetratricopeptide (TPR) repeat protein
MSGSRRKLYFGGLFYAILLCFLNDVAVSQGPQVDRTHRGIDVKRFYEEILQKNTRNAEAHYFLGIEYLREPQNTEKAVDHLEKAVAIEGDNAEYHYRLAEAYIADFTYASIFRKPFIAGKVKFQLEEAVRRDPRAIQFREALIQYYISAPSIFGGSYPKALEQADAIAAIDPYLGTVARANIYAEEGETEKAITLFKKAMRMHPEGWQAYHQFGLYYLNRRRVDDAIALFKKYAAVAPYSPDSHCALARAYERKRMYDEAIGEYQAAFRQDQSLVHLMFRMAQLYEFKGSKADAIRHYRKYLEVVPSGRTAEDARTKIRNLSG